MDPDVPTIHTTPQLPSPPPNPTSHNSPMEPTRTSPLSLQEITEHNWRAVTRLSVHPRQSGNLATNAMSLLESHYDEDAWVRAVYADTTTLVGFLMLAIWEAGDAYYIWRFMIDHRFQGLGFGRRVLEMALDHIRTNHPTAKEVRVNSTPREGKEGVEAVDSPFMFYERLGFRQCEEPDEDGEVQMRIELRREEGVRESGGSK